MNELTTNKVVTTQELATVLNVGESTVKRAIEKLRPVLGGVSKNKQGGYLFNEEQATAIKKEIQSHHNLQSRQIDNVSTEVEENEIILQAQNILVNRINELKSKLQEQKPKVELYDKAMDTKGVLSIGEAAKLLHTGRNTLFNFLRYNSILEPSNVPYQQYINRGYFVVKEIHIEYLDTMKPTTFVTQKGLDFINKLLNKGE